MRVMLSWSGGRSKEVAQGLADLIKQVLGVQTWVSSTDLRPGVVWPEELLRVLQDARVGIVCLTPENLLSSWIHFEAGVLLGTTQQMRRTKSRNKAPQPVVCTYLFEVKPDALHDPLALFQATLAEEKDTKKLIEAINALLPPSRRVQDKYLDKSFAAFWPGLAAELDRIRALPAQTGADDILSEIRIARAEARKKFAASAGGR